MIGYGRMGSAKVGRGRRGRKGWDGSRLQCRMGVTL